VDLHVGEKSTRDEKIRINADQFRDEYLVNVSKYAPELDAKLRPPIDAETALADVNRKIQENAEKQKALADDEARDRDNLTALKGNDAANALWRN